MFKKFTGILLAFALLTASVNAFAKDVTFSDMKATDYYADAAKALSALDILEGYPDKTFGASKFVTRAEMAAVVCRMTGLSEKDTDTDFSDVDSDHWAAGYIGAAAENKIINGDGDGKFRPEDNVKYEEAIKMVVCSLGYGDGVTVTRKNWREVYISVADEKGITDSLIGKVKEAATRGDIAVMSYNGMRAQVYAPVASVDAGTYTNRKSVVLKTQTPDAEIYYTTNGTTPTISSSKYTKPITVGKTLTLKAIAVKDGVLKSDVMSVDYKIKFIPMADDEIVFTDEKCNVSFNLNYENAPEAPKSQTVVSGNTIEAPQIEERNGYIFGGWFVDKEYSEIFDFDEPITSDVTLYAKWILETDTEAVEDSLSVIIIDEIHPHNGKCETHFETAPKQAVKSVSAQYELEKGLAEVVISPVTRSRGICSTCGLVGTPVAIELVGDDEVEEAEITFEYDESQLGTVNPEDLSIAWYNYERKIVEIVPSKIDKVKRTVTAKTTHFSEYCLIDTKAWFESWKKEQLVVRDQTDDLTYFNVVLVLDASGSMEGDNIVSCRNAATAFVEQLVEGDCVSVIKFSSSASRVVEPTVIDGTNLASVKTGISRIYASGGTNFNGALSSALSTLNSMPKTRDNEVCNIEPFIVFMSDGQSDVSASTLTALKESGALTISVGLGNDVQDEPLRQIALSADGKYVKADTASDLVAVFEQIQAEYIGSTKDTDGDGIPDLVETSGMRNQFGEIVRTNPEKADTDGDGFSDGYEMGKFVEEGGSTRFEMISSPTTPTAKSDKAQLEIISAYNKVDYNKKNVLNSEFDTHKVTVKVKAKRYHIYSDLLSDVVYELPKSIKPVINGGKVTVSDVVCKKAEDASGDITYFVTFSAKASDYSEDIPVEISVSADNAEAVNMSHTIDFYTAWKNVADKFIEEHEVNVNKAGGKIASAIADAADEIDSDFTNAITLSGGLSILGNEAPQSLTKQITEKLCSEIKAQIKADRDKLFSSTNPEEIVKAVAKNINDNADSYEFIVNGKTYKIKQSGFGFGNANYWQIIAESPSGEQFNFAVCSSEEALESAVSDYMTSIKALSEQAIDDCINAIKSDTKKLLGIDKLEKLVKVWGNDKAGKFISSALQKAGISVSKSEVKELCTYFKDAKKLLKKCSDTSTTKKIDSAMKAMNTYLLKYGAYPAK